MITEVLSPKHNTIFISYYLDVVLGNKTLGFLGDGLIYLSKKITDALSLFF